MKKKRKAFSVYALASGEFGEKLHNTDCYQGEHWGKLITGGSRGGPGSPTPPPPFCNQNLKKMSVDPQKISFRYVK